MPRTGRVLAPARPPAARARRRPPLAAAHAGPGRGVRPSGAVPAGVRPGRPHGLRGPDRRSRRRPARPAAARRRAAAGAAAVSGRTARAAGRGGPPDPGPDHAGVRQRRRDRQPRGDRRRPVRDRAGGRIRPDGAHPVRRLPPLRAAPRAGLRAAGGTAAGRPGGHPVLRRVHRLRAARRQAPARPVRAGRAAAHPDRGRGRGADAGAGGGGALAADRGPGLAAARQGGRTGRAVHRLLPDRRGPGRPAGADLPRREPMFRVTDGRS